MHFERGKLPTLSPDGPQRAFATENMRPAMFYDPARHVANCGVRIFHGGTGNGSAGGGITLHEPCQQG